MKAVVLVFLLPLSLFLASCAAQTSAVTILMDDRVISLATRQVIPTDILVEAGVILKPTDRLLYLGAPVPLDAALPTGTSLTLVVRRAVTLTLHTTGGETESFASSAQTIAQALAEHGVELHASDRLEPDAGTPILADMDITWQPASEITIQVDGGEIHLRSAAPSVGAALAEAGLPLTGLDYSLPAESEPLPADGNLRIVRVSESFALTLKSVPYSTRSELTADLEIDHQELIQGGEPGLVVTRLRTRVEDGEVLSQVSEAETVVRPPQDQVLGIGTQIVIRTAVVGGETIEYWRALNLYATYYVPCGAGQPTCLYGTSIGTAVRKGEVAMVYPWFLLFAHEHLYIPGYGFAIVEDTNGAMVNALGDTYWVDLGYSMTDVVDWETQYVTVYFLTPVPANVAETYLLP